jgi:hypothetical protein
MRALVVLLTTASLAFAGEPAIDGKDRLLPPAEARAVLVAAREKLAKEYPYFSIMRLHVLSAVTVQAYFRDSPSQEEHLSCLVVERTQGHWTVTGELQDVWNLIGDH